MVSTAEQTAVRKWQKCVGWNGPLLSLNLRGNASDISDELWDWVGITIEEKQNEGVEVVASNVDFSSCKLTSTDLTRLIDILEMYNVPCQRLKLFDNKITDVSSICRFLESEAGQQIREIHLSHNQLDATQCATLVSKCAELGPNPLPIWLRIEHNNVDDPESVVEGYTEPQVTVANGLREAPKDSSVAIHRSFFQKKGADTKQAPRGLPSTGAKPASIGAARTNNVAAAPRVPQQAIKLTALRPNTQHLKPSVGGILPGQLQRAQTIATNPRARPQMQQMQQQMRLQMQQQMQQQMRPLMQQQMRPQMQQQMRPQMHLSIRQPSRLSMQQQMRPQLRLQPQAAVLSAPRVLKQVPTRDAPIIRIPPQGVKRAAPAISERPVKVAKKAFPAPPTAMMAQPTRISASAPAGLKKFPSVLKTETVRSAATAQLRNIQQGKLMKQIAPSKKIPVPPARKKIPVPPSAVGKGKVGHQAPTSKSAGCRVLHCPKL